MARDRAKTFGRLLLRYGGIALLVVATGALGWLGWQWQANAPVTHVAVTGTQHAPADTVRHLARVDSGTVMHKIDPVLVADRVVRHPWIKRAEVTPRRIRHTLRIRVIERTPVGLVVNRQGRPAYYLDPTGHAMPVPDSAGYDVPLVRGLHADGPPESLKGVQGSPSLRRVFAALSETDTDALVAEIELRPDSTIGLVTRPLEGHGAVPVRLGRSNFSDKLRTLRAFATQVLARRPRPDSTANWSGPDAPIAEIDLRFDGQIITREHPLDG